MKYLLNKSLLPLILLSCFILFAAEEHDILNEITRTKRELSRMMKERQKVYKAVAQDKKEFEAYKTRTKQRMASLSAQTDSVRQAVGIYQKRSDSLGAVLSGIQAQQKEYDLKQNHLRDNLIMLCDKAISSSRETTPSISEKAVPALDFLKSELAAGNIDNIEGIHRLVQILNDLELWLMDIQISQGTSPLSEIHGTVSRLRIGGVFEAIVDTKGEKSAIWSGGSDGEWVPIDNVSVSARILKAIHIREGKTVPGFIELPFSLKEEGGSDE